MKMKNKRRNTVIVFLVITILIFGSILFLNNIVLLGPAGQIYDTTPGFIWSGFEDDYRLLVDQSSEFESPIIDVPVKGNKFTVSEGLDFGGYYWKVISEDKTSITGYFVIDSEIRMELDEKLRNKGNTPVLISGLTGRAILDINEEMNVTEGEYKVEQL